MTHRVVLLDSERHIGLRHRGGVISLPPAIHYPTECLGRKFNHAGSHFPLKESDSMVHSERHSGTIWSVESASSDRHADACVMDK